MLTHFGRATGILALVVITVSVVAAAQSTPATKTDTSSDALLTEVRGLRADFQQTARISLRAQLLVGRLQLQEQRISAVAGRLSEVRRLIGVNQSGRIPLAEQLKRLDELRRDGATSASAQKDLDSQISLLGAQFAQMQREEQQLRVQETESSGELATEQGRWLDFNSRLDELETQLPVSPR